MRPHLVAAPLLGLAVFLAACGSGAAKPTAAPASAAAVTPAATEAPPVTAGGGAATIALADTGLGKVLVNGKGMTVYAFKPDNAGDSTCYDKCAAAWPPVLSEGAPTAGGGLAAGDLGTTTRTDGGTQVTFKGWPLYLFSGDAAAGDTKGQGLKNVWYVVDATGAMVGAAAAPAASAPAASAAPGSGVVVNVASTSLGDILVDGKGLTLYTYTADANGKSACTGDCLTNWPALIGDAAAPGAGLGAEDFATITRDDGAKQITFYKMPLYTFAGDKAAGDVAGQGLGGKWYVVKADGTVVK
jgi:predicted lipoprotein with Yx(FWY)xxD motif